MFDINIAIYQLETDLNRRNEFVKLISPFHNPLSQWRLVVRRHFQKWRDSGDGIEVLTLEKLHKVKPLTSSQVLQCAPSPGAQPIRLLRN